MNSRTFNAFLVAATMSLSGCVVYSHGGGGGGGGGGTLLSGDVTMQWTLAGGTCNDLKYDESIGDATSAGIYGARRSASATGYVVWAVFDPGILVLGSTSVNGAFPVDSPVNDGWSQLWFCTELPAATSSRIRAAAFGPPMFATRIVGSRGTVRVEFDTVWIDDAGGSRQEPVPADLTIVVGKDLSRKH